MTVYALMHEDQFVRLQQIGGRFYTALEGPLLTFTDRLEAELVASNAFSLGERIDEPINQLTGCRVVMISIKEV